MPDLKVVTDFYSHNFRIKYIVLMGVRGHWTMNYIGTQSFINISRMLGTIFGVLFFFFDWLAKKHK